MWLPFWRYIRGFLEPAKINRKGKNAICIGDYNEV